MKKNVHRSNERGEANHHWLHSRFSFSFAHYYNPNRLGFGKLRVVNDDIVAPGEGFGTHPHNNMEIISIPTEGELAHKDSTGSEEVIVPGQVQVMSAGSGILHSEYNYSHSKELKFFQIWIETATQNVIPRHETKTLDLKKNQLTKIVSGEKNENTLFIHQNASLWLGEFDTKETIVFKTNAKRGTFVMIVEGTAIIEDEVLSKRDSIEVEDANNIDIKTNRETKLLLIDVPKK